MREQEREIETGKETDVVCGMDEVNMCLIMY